MKPNLRHIWGTVTSKGNGCYRFLSTSIALAIVACCFPAGIAFPEQTPKEARVTVVVHDVKLLPENKDPRTAEVNETVTEDTAVRTGDLSRSELAFLDLTITRLGSNTIFSFNKAGRSVQLNSGSILLRVPKNSGGANLKTDACSVAISGTVLILEANPDGTNRLAVLNGEAKMSLNQYPDESEVARGGQMLDVPSGATKMPKPKKIDVKKLVNQHPLLANFPPLPNEDDLYGGGGAEKKTSVGNKTPQDPVVYNPPPPPGSSAPTGSAPTGPIGPAGPVLIPTGPPYTGDHDDHPSHDGDGKTKNPKYPKDPKNADNPPKDGGDGDKPPKGGGGKKKKKMPPSGGSNVNNDGIALPNGGGGGKVYKGRLPAGKAVGGGNANVNADANSNLGKAAVGNKLIGQPVNANANAAKPTPTPRRKHKRQH